jgi:DNA-binding transcriptional ArsR family regulator
MASSGVVEASLVKASGHPLRMRLLTFITERGEASPVEMSRALDVPLATVSHHTRVLRDLRYIELSRTEPRRGAMEHYYRALAAPFLDDEHWDKLPIPARRHVSAQRGWRELSRAVLMLLHRAEAIQARSDARRDGRDGHEDARPSELAILHFATAEPPSSGEAAPRRRARSPRLP